MASLAELSHLPLSAMVVKLSLLGSTGLANHLQSTHPSETDALGHVTTYEYDDLGRMVKTIFVL
ncbi:RHS repeat domain-containing protein [Alkalinema pantanalense CENA528]